METHTQRVVVVGGGAAGMMAALFAARAGASVLLLEANEKLGKKLYITGKGRCNLTNAMDMDAFMAHIIRNPRFLYASLSLLDNLQLMALFESLGVPLKQERGSRVYPVSEHASDINRALERELRRLGVSIRLGARVAHIEAEDGRVVGLALEDGERINCARAILATGGLSYPLTGSTGDGHHMAKAQGHALKEMLPALTGLETVEAWPQALMGLTLKNVQLRAGGGKKPLFAQQGELLFTHFGISGPLALTLSSLLPNPCQGTPLFIDLKPALDEQALDARVLRDLTAAPNKRLGGVMDGLAPHNLALTVLDLAALPAAMPAHSVTAAARKQIVHTLKHLPLTVKKLRGFDEAVITRGGVDVKDVNPSTMESKRLKGLFFAGELLDIDALTGGFNLQLAFSTGALAGSSAARKELSQ